jgi:hypothetical protein
MDSANNRLAKNHRERGMGGNIRSVRRGDHLHDRDSIRLCMDFCGGTPNTDQNNHERP